MPGKGRKLPKLEDEHLIHLRMVYDKKGLLRYAYWSDGKWATNASKDLSHFNIFSEEDQTVYGFSVSTFWGSFGRWTRIS
jgi:hypothetical protein